MAEVEQLKGGIAEQTERGAGEGGGRCTRSCRACPTSRPPDVPVGAGRGAPTSRIRRWGEPFAIDEPQGPRRPRRGLGLMDFEAAARMSGARFVVLQG